MPPLFKDEERPDDDDEWDNESYDYSNDEGEDDEDDEPIDKPIIVRISGKELLETDHKLCEVCEEWAEEAEATAAEYQYRRP